MSSVELLVKRLSENATIPTRGSVGAAGYDLSSAVDIVVPARGKALVPTDLSIKLPESVYGRVAARSGLALKHSIDVGAGVIDVREPNTCIIQSSTSQFVLTVLTVLTVPVVSALRVLYRETTAGQLG